MHFSPETKARLQWIGVGAAAAAILVPAAQFGLNNDQRVPTHCIDGQVSSGIESGVLDAARRQHLTLDRAAAHEVSTELLDEIAGATPDKTIDPGQWIAVGLVDGQPLVARLGHCATQMPYLPTLQGQ